MFVSHYLRNVHYLLGDSLTPSYGDLFISGKDGKITLGPASSPSQSNLLPISQLFGGPSPSSSKTSLTDFEVGAGELVSQLMGGQDYEYLVIPAFSNALDFSVIKSAPEHFSPDEIEQGQIYKLEAMLRQELEKNKLQGVSNVSIYLPGANALEKAILETCLKESGLTGTCLISKDSVEKENQVTFRQNALLGLPNPQFTEDSQFEISTGNVRIITSDIWSELHAITLDLMNKNQGQLPVSAEAILRSAFRGNGKFNSIANGATSDLLILQLDHSHMPYKGAKTLLLKGSSKMVQGMIQNGKFTFLSQSLDYQISPLHSTNAENIDGCEFDSVEDALVEFAKGNFVVVVDNEDRENEGDLLIACEHMTEEKMAFMIRHTSGLVCMAASGDWLKHLRLPLMIQENNESFKTAFTVSIDYIHGTTTGISAHDRALTARQFGNPKVEASDFNRPGHMFPLRAQPGGVMVRQGHTEATVDLCKMSGLFPAGVLCEIALDNGKMARRDYLRTFANEHGLKMITIADMIKYRQSHGLQMI